MNEKVKTTLEQLVVLQHIMGLQRVMNGQPPLENFDRSTEKVLNTLEMIAERDVRMSNMYLTGSNNMGSPAPARPQPSPEPAGRSSTKERIQSQEILDLKNIIEQQQNALDKHAEEKAKIYEEVNALRQRLAAEFYKVTEEIYDSFFPGA